MSSFTSSVPNVYLKVLSSDSRKFGSCTTPVPLVWTLVSALTRTLDSSAFFSAALSGKGPKRMGSSPPWATTVQPFTDRWICQSNSLTTVSAANSESEELSISKRGMVRPATTTEVRKRAPWGVVSSFAEPRTFWNASASSRVGRVTRTRSFTLTSELTTLE